VATSPWMETEVARVPFSDADGVRERRDPPPEGRLGAEVAKMRRVVVGLFALVRVADWRRRESGRDGRDGVSVGVLINGVDR